MKHLLPILLCLMFASMSYGQTLTRLQAIKNMKSNIRSVITNGGVVVTPLPTEKTVTYNSPNNQDYGYDAAYTGSLNYNSPFYGLAYSYSYQNADARFGETKIYSHYWIRSNPLTGLTRQVHAEGYNYLVQQYSIAGTSPKWQVPIRLYAKLNRPSYTTHAAGDGYDQEVDVYADSNNFLNITWDDSMNKWRVVGAVNGVARNYTIFNSSGTYTTVQEFGTQIVVGDTPFNHVVSVNGSPITMQGISQGGIAPGGYREDRIRTWASVLISGAITP